MTINIIGLCGYKRAGKDTAAAYLSAWGFKRLAFADKLYQEVAQAFNVSVELLGEHRTKETPLYALSLANCAQSDFVQLVLRLEGGAIDDNLHKPRSPRKIMQMWGTEFRRGLYRDDYWTSVVGEEIAKNPAQKYVITDVRFPNEAEMLKGLVGRQPRIIRILRKGQSGVADMHPSERMMDGYEEDVRLENIEGRPEVLQSALQDYLLTDSVLK